MTPAKPNRNPSPKVQSKKPKPPTRPSAFEKAMDEMQNRPPTAFPLVSPRWLLSALGIALLSALAASWLALCFLYSQGSWQLLYHPAAPITRTPASLGLSYEPIRFAATETGVTQLTGWWIPNSDSKQTVLYLHGADGNLSDTLEAIAALRKAGLSIFAIDYRGYGQSAPAHPSERQLKQDAELAVTWLISTRTIRPKSIIIFGSNLGANLALEVSSDFPTVGGVILDAPEQDALRPIFTDPRSRLVPARWLVSDRYDLESAASSLKAPSLWLFAKPDPGQIHSETPTGVPPAAYQKDPSRKQSAWLTNPSIADPNFVGIIKRWSDDL